MAVQFLAHGLFAAAWIADVNDTHPYVLADLASRHVISSIATQSRGHVNSNTQFVTSYKLEYSDDGVSFSPVSVDGDQHQIFTANE